MGLINNDQYTAPNGAQTTGSYISFATETLYLRQGQGMMPGNASVQSGGYTVNANYRVYWNKECREMGMSFIDLKSISVQLTREQLSCNLYGILYSQLKLQYPNTVDENNVNVHLPDASSAPLPDASSAPLPDASSAPLPDASSAPLPDASSAPLPDASSAPLPDASSAEVPVNP